MACCAVEMESKFGWGMGLRRGVLLVLIVFYVSLRPKCATCCGSRDALTYTSIDV